MKERQCFLVLHFQSIGLYDKRIKFDSYALTNRNLILEGHVRIPIPQQIPGGGYHFQQKLILIGLRYGTEQMETAGGLMELR